MKPVTNASSTRKHSQKGAVAVEMAIVLPLFAIFLLGIFDLGSAAREHQVLQNAAREGARFASMGTNSMAGANGATVLATIRARVLAYLQNEGVTVPAANIVVDQNFPVTVGTYTVEGTQVTITYNRPWIFTGSGGYLRLPGSLNLQGRAVFRNLP